jgi:hypothetical protein
MRELWPPIEVIRGSLEPLPPAFLEDCEFIEDNQTMQVVVPEFLKDRIRRRVASRTAGFDLSPEEGKILRFDGIGIEARPICVLLDMHFRSNLWEGWIVAPECDYATDQDMLLEQQDEPCDPLASMIQTWNRVTADVEDAVMPVGILSRARLEAVREVSNGMISGAIIGARPGFVAPTLTMHQHPVLVGSPLSTVSDRRSAYRDIYFRLAARITIKQKNNI